jgi:CRISPR-associated endonuclease Cas2
MKYYLIAYDLKQPGRNYTELYDEIKNLGDWKHPLESLWIVYVNDNMQAKLIRELLRKKMDENDLILVVDITSSEYAGWLANSFWSWFKKM